jgi:hypothetical protein
MSTLADMAFEDFLCPSHKELRKVGHLASVGSVETFKG